MNTQGCSPLGWTGLISLLFKDSEEFPPAPQLGSINASGAQPSLLQDECYCPLPCPWQPCCKKIISSSRSLGHDVPLLHLLPHFYQMDAVTLLWISAVKETVLLLGLQESARCRQKQQGHPKTTREENREGLRLHGEEVSNDKTLYLHPSLHP